MEPQVRTPWFKILNGTRLRKPVLQSVMITLVTWFGSPTPAAAQSTIHVPADQATIQAAIDAATDGDTVLVSAGTYTENISFKGKAITVKSAAGPTVTIIQGQQFGSPVILFGFSESRSSLLQGFTIQNGTATFGSGISLSGSSATIVGNIFVSNSEGSGGFGAGIGGNGSSPDIEQNVFQNNSCDSQYTSGVVSFVNLSSPTVANNLFINNSCRAIDMTLPQGSAPQVINNTIVGNPVGIRVDARIPTAQQIFENNVVVNNTIGLQVDFNSPGNEPTWKNNLVFGNGTNYSGISDETGSSGNISVDPVFVNTTGADFHLQANSPAIDAGDNAAPSLSVKDFDGNDRILDGNGDCIATVDMGAYEFARPSVLTFSPNLLAFPDQLVGTTSAALSSTITNTGSTAAKVCGFSVTGDFSQTNTCAFSIAAKGTCAVNVDFTPTTHGPRAGLLQLITSDAGSPQTIILTGKGVAPNVALSGNALNFAAQQVGTTSAAQTVTLNNTGDGQLIITNVTALGDFSQSNTCGNAVAPRANCTISVTFAPTTSGNRTGSLSITDNASGSPHTVSLAGSATDFALAAAASGSTTATVTDGNTATYNLQVSSLNGFAGTVALGCAGAPALAVCTVAPSSVALSGPSSAFTVTVTTTAPSLVTPPAAPREWPPIKPLFIELALLVALFVFALKGRFQAKASGRRLRLAYALAIISIALVTASGCGGGGGVHNPGTPKGTSTLTITGTSGGANHTLDLKLTVN